MQQNFWKEGNCFTLKESEIHVWRSYLNTSMKYLHELRNYLSPMELQKASQFKFQKDRNRYIVSHGILRDIVGRYIKKDPKKIEFGYSTYGKPFLQTNTNPSIFSFNLSHSKDLIVYSFTRDSTN